MRHLRLSAVGLLLVGYSVIAVSQIKDIPSQAEFDPILENADSKLRDFQATLSTFRAEASALDEDRLRADLDSIAQLHQMIEITHSSTKAKNAGFNMQRLIGILSGLDDMALDAATWKSLGELTMCQRLVQQQDASRFDQLSGRATINSQMLREVGGQLLHPTLRLSAAMDQMVTKLSDAASK